MNTLDIAGPLQLNTKLFPILLTDLDFEHLND